MCRVPDLPCCPVLSVGSAGETQDEGGMTMPNLATLLTESAGRHPDRPALKLDDTTMSYEALDEATARVAGLLQQRGIGAGDRVGVMLPNVPHFAIVYYGVLRAGGVVVPMNVLLKGREVKFY